MLAHAWISEHLTHQKIPTQYHESMTLILNSADDRGITAIRQRLTEFVRRVFPIVGAKAWILIDDADNLPVVTQQALRRILELHVHHALFCFIAKSCEYFIEPIQSRCVILWCNPVDLNTYGHVLLDEYLSPALRAQVDDTNLQNIIGICHGNAHQFVLICKGLASSGDVLSLNLLINGMPVTILLRLQNAIIANDLHIITECVLLLWSKGYSYEDCLDLLYLVVITYNDVLTKDHQYVIQVCGEGHINQILNRMTTLDLIEIFSGMTSSECLTTMSNIT